MPDMTTRLTALDVAQRVLDDYDPDWDLPLPAADRVRRLAAFGIDHDQGHSYLAVCYRHELRRVP